MLIELNQAALQNHFGSACSAPIFISHHCQLQDEIELNFNETQKLAEFTSEKRKVEYILGRYALKNVLACIAQDTDTSRIIWPHANCSLSHSAGHAVAVASKAYSGVGIDLQLNKIPPFAMADRILSGQTLSYWQQLADLDKAKYLQRFWTANEAIYKACPAPQPAYFRHYRLHTPEFMHSVASIDNTDLQFKVFSAELSNGFISIALRQ